MSNQCDHKTGPSTTTTEADGTEITECVCGYVLCVTEAASDD